MKKIITIVFLAFLFQVASAQMSGSFTLDSTSTATATNFKTWKSFANALQGLSRDDGGSNYTGGITAAVTLTVNTNAYISTSVNLGPISGTSATNTITINGNSKSVTLTSGSSSNFVFEFTGMDYVTIKNLTVIQPKTTGKIGIFRFAKRSDYNTLQSLTLQFNASSALKAAYVAFSRNAISPYDTGAIGENGRNNIVDGCVMKTAGSTAIGPDFGIFENQHSGTYSSSASNNIFKNNDIQNFNGTGILVMYANGTQITGNSISRKNTSTSPTANLLFGIEVSEAAASSQSVKINGNTIQDLPVSGAGSSNSGAEIKGIVTSNLVGSSTYTTEIKSNVLKSLVSSVGITTISCDLNYGLIESNTISKNSTFGGANMIGTNITGTYLQVNKNLMENNIVDGDIGGFGVSSNSLKGNTCNENVFKKNEILGNGGNNSMIAFGFSNSSSGIYAVWNAHKNQVIYNDADNGLSGTFFGFYVEDATSINLGSNLIAGNVMADDIALVYATSNDTAAKVNIHHNTFHLDNSSSSLNGSEFARMVDIYSYGEFSMQGNIFVLEGVGEGAQILYDGSGTDFEISHNSYHFNNIGFSGEWIFQWNFYYTLSDWHGSGYVGKTEYENNPKFNNISTLDYKSNNYLNQNSVPYNSIFTTDLLGNNRNTKYADRGAYETSFDPQLTRFVSPIGSNTCSGTPWTVKLRIKNNFTDTLKQLYVYYKLDNKTPVVDSIKSNILPGDSLLFSFSKTISAGGGVHNLIAYLSIGNDNYTNDSLKHSFTIKQSPMGCKYIPGSQPTTAKYTGNPFAVAEVGVPVYLEVTTPKTFSNSGFGTTWNAISWAYTSGGSTAGFSLITTNAGTNNYSIQFKATSTTLEDSTVWICTKVTELMNGCDTIFCTQIKIAPSPHASFTTAATLCEGDTIAFTNKSTIKGGTMNYTWHFGTTNKDSSQLVNPSFKFSSPGNYTVKLIAQSLPYDFYDTFTKTITINAKPKVSFTRTNVCDGEKNVFTNTSTPLTATFVWKKDGNAFTIPLTAPWTEGTYTVLLTGTLNGCSASTSSKVSVFPKPKPSIVIVSGTCSNDSVQFADNTTISSGTWGRIWKFGENNAQSNLSLPKYRYTAGGTKSIKLITISDLGCKDSTSKSLTLKQAPTAAYTYNSFCSVKPTKFQNTTVAVSGTVANYFWDFGDATNSSIENPTKTWNKIGSTTVKFKVSLDNGCTDVLTKTYNILAQPKANFDIPHACSGTEAQFNNTTTWPQGSITNSWYFENGNQTSTATSPKVTFSSATGKLYKVTLTSTIVGGCADSITKNVFVNPVATTCDFDLSADYAFAFYGLKASPKTAAGTYTIQNGVNYYWKLETLQPVLFNGNYQMSLPGDGKYCVTMTATTDSGCSCSANKCFTMDRAAVEHLQKTGIALWPNPSTGNISFSIPEILGMDCKISVLDVSGKVVYRSVSKLQPISKITLNHLSEGIYYLQILANNKIWSEKIVLKK